jgi:hypothetical protein
MRQLLKEERIYGLRFEGGDKLGFLKDTVEFALKRSDLREDFAQARTYFRSAGSFYTQMLAGEQPNFGDGEQSREFTYIANMVRPTYWRHVRRRSTVPARMFCGARRAGNGMTSGGGTAY